MSNSSPASEARVVLTREAIQAGEWDFTGYPYYGGYGMKVEQSGRRFSREWVLIMEAHDNDGPSSVVLRTLRAV